MAVVSLLGATNAFSQTWLPTAGGSFYFWNTSSNWAGGVPNSSSANVSLSPSTSLQGSQVIYQEGQSVGSITIGDPGGQYGQELLYDGQLQPLSIGTSGSTALIYVNGPSFDLLNVNQSAVDHDGAFIDMSINMHNANLHVISNRYGNINTTYPYFQTIDLGGGLSNGANLEITHTYCYFEGNPTYPISYTGSTTLDGGYATLDMTDSEVSLPSTTALNLSDSTDLFVIGATAQTVGSITGPGTILISGAGSGLTTTANNTTFAGHLAGPGPLSLDSGTLTLTGNNAASSGSYPAFTGGIFLGSPATLSVSSASNLGTGTNGINMYGGTLSATGTFSVSNPITFYYSSYINVAASQVLTLNGAVSYQTPPGSSGIEDLIKNGSGALVLANYQNNLYGLDVAAGTVQFSAGSNIQTFQNTMEIDAGTLELLANNTVTTSQNVAVTTSTSTVQVDQNSTLTISATVNDLYEEGGDLHGPRGGLTVSGQGTLVLSGTNSYTLGTTINGNLSISSDQNLGIAGTAVTFGSTLVSSGLGYYSAPGNLITTSNITTTRPIVLGTAGGNFSPAAGTTVTLNGTISDGGNGTSVNVTGPGTVVLGGTNTFSGGVSLGSGTLNISSDSNLGSYTSGSSTGGITFAGGSLQFSGTDTTLRPVTIGYGTTAGISSNGGVVFTLAGPITGGGSISKTGNGDISFTSANTFSGGVTIASGSVDAGPIPASSTTGPLGTGPVNLAGGVLRLNGGQLGALSQGNIPTTGWNQDVVVEKSTSPTGYQAAVTTSFDDYPYTNAGYALYEQGYVGPGNTNGGSTGLPTGGSIYSQSGSGVSFSLQPYAANNVLLVTPGTGYNALNLVTQGAFHELMFLATAVNGASTVSIAIEFNDGTYYYTQASVPDWFTTTTAAYSVGGRLSLSDGTFQVPGNGNPQLFEIDVPIPVADQSKAVSATAFDVASGGTVGVFALTGLGALVSPTQNYTNKVNVTANSNIYVNGSTSATMGALSIGSNSLTVEGNSGGSLTFPSASITGNATFDVFPGFTLHLGTVSGGGSITLGSGTFPGAGTVTYTPNGGTLSSLNISSGGTVSLPAIHSHLILGSLNLGGAPVDPNGLLDLGNNDLIVQNGSLADLTAEIASGFGSGEKKWTGPAGITSYTAATDPSDLHGLGILLNSGDIYNISNPFDGYVPATTDVLIKYTYYGDTNLDGQVDGSDYSRIDSAYLADRTNPGAFTGWFNGDFNYDGAVNGSDYTLIDNAFNRQGAQLTSQIGDLFAIATSQIAAPAAVPEPTVVGILTVATGGLLARRRRDSNGRID